MDGRLGGTALQALDEHAHGELDQGTAGRVGVGLGEFLPQALHGCGQPAQARVADAAVTLRYYLHGCGCGTAAGRDGVEGAVHAFSCALLAALLVACAGRWLLMRTISSSASTGLVT